MVLSNFHTVKAGADIATQYVWPNISESKLYEMYAVPIVLFILVVVWLRILWTKNEDMFTKEETCCCPGSVQHAGQPTLAGRQYAEDWHKTFDLVFLLVMTVCLGVLVGVTVIYEPHLFHEMNFWKMNFVKLILMMVVSLLGGALCRSFCPVDEEGYITTSKASWFKVNYTRKFQHFAAYAIPLLIKTDVPGNPVLHLMWGDFFTLIGFLVLIKPLRESFQPFMLMFNSLDRPEDRPHCLKWIIAGNIWPGLLMIVFFDWLFLRFGPAQQKLVMIFVLVAGVGDGLAEPVGIYTGRHKYRTRSCGTSAVYLRSFEGSACVFLTSFIWIIWYYQSFENELQFWICMAVLPITSAIAEATSPHTMDTPFLMGLGGLIIYVLLRWY
eukprot:g4049.t1